jgi:hypothetical protein
MDDHVDFLAVRSGGIERETEIGELTRFGAGLFCVAEDENPAFRLREEMDSRTSRARRALNHTWKFGPWAASQSRGRP